MVLDMLRDTNLRDCVERAQEKYQCETPEDVLEWLTTYEPPVDLFDRAEQEARTITF